MAISQLHSIWKVQMANCRHKEIILGTLLCRENLASAPGVELWQVRLVVWCVKVSPSPRKIPRWWTGEGWGQRVGNFL